MEKKSSNPSLPPFFLTCLHLFPILGNRGKLWHVDHFTGLAEFTGISVNSVKFPEFDSCCTSVFLSCYLISVWDCIVKLNYCLVFVLSQLLAYHLTVLRGYNVDQPRNLAKSVTTQWAKHFQSLPHSTSTTWWLLIWSTGTAFDSYYRSHWPRI